MSDYEIPKVLPNYFTLNVYEYRSNNLHKLCFIFKEHPVPVVSMLVHILFGKLQSTSSSPRISLGLEADAQASYSFLKFILTSVVKI